MTILINYFYIKKVQKIVLKKDTVTIIITVSHKSIYCKLHNILSAKALNILPVIYFKSVGVKASGSIDSNVNSSI